MASTHIEAVGRPPGKTDSCSSTPKNKLPGAAAAESVDDGMSCRNSNLQVLQGCLKMADFEPIYFRNICSNFVTSWFELWA